MNIIDEDIATFDSHQSLPSDNDRDDDSVMVDLVSQSQSQSVTPRTAATNVNSSRKRMALDPNEEGLPEKPAGPLTRLTVLNSFLEKGVMDMKGNCLFGKCIHCQQSIKIHKKIDGIWTSLTGNYIHSHLVGEGPRGGCTAFQDKIKAKQLPPWYLVPIRCLERIYRKEEVKSSSRTSAAGTETSTLSTSRISNWFRPSVEKQPMLSTSVRDEQVNLALMDRLPFAAVSTAQMSAFANAAGRVGYKQGYQNGVRDARRQKDIVVNLDTAIVEYAEIKLADRRVVGDLVRTEVVEMQTRMKQCLADLRDLNLRLSGTTDIWTEFGRPFISLTLSFVLAGSRQSFVLSLMPMETMSKSNEGIAVALHAII